MPKARAFVVFFLVLFADLVSKYWVAHHLPIIQLFLGYPFGGIGVFQTPWITFSIVHTTNTGMAWGMLSDFQTALLVMRVLILGGIVAYLMLGTPHKRVVIPLTCIAAGALGNILSTLIYGCVIDMFSLMFYRYRFPIFNVADAAIFLAAIYLFCTSKTYFLTRHARLS